MLIAFFKILPKQLKVLDFGMGWGVLCQIAKAIGCESFGSELSEARIEHAKSKSIKIIDYEKLPKH